MAITLVQSKSSVLPETLAFDATPTAGNLLVAWAWAGTVSAITATGFTSAGTYSMYGDDRVAVLYKVSDGSESSALGISAGVSTRMGVIAEFSGAGSLVDSATLANGAKDITSGTIGPVTVTSPALLVGLVGADNRESSAHIQHIDLPAGWSLVSEGPTGPNNIFASAAYRVVSSADDYPLTGSFDSTSDWPYYPAPGLDPSGWAGVLLAFAETQVAGVFADWADDGFGDDTSLDYIAGDVKSWRITRGAAAEITGGAQPGQATITLINPSDDRYNPLNTGGDLYGLLTDGVPVWIGVNSDGALTGSDPRGLFGGRIADITPIPQSSGLGRVAFVEIGCEDALGWYRRTPVRIEDAIGRSHAALRAAMLTDGGETRTSLPSEIMTMPLSSWDGSLLDGLEAINRATGSRHFAKPADTATSWYTYTVRNRQWRLDATTDASIDAGADYVTGSTGWRLSADTVINQQKATVTPVRFTPGAVTVWQADRDTLPMVVEAEKVIWVEFDAYVDSPVADYTYTGTAPTVTLEPFGKTAKLTLDSAGSTTFTRLTIEGSLAKYGAAESVVEDDTASQAGTRGVRSGNEISGDFVGTIANARGLAAHVVWRYGTPQYRPTMTVVNWIPEMFEIDLYDVIAVTIDQLGMTARLFEVVGLTLECDVAASATVKSHTATYVLQESAVQADPGWFVLDSSLLDGADILAY